MYSTAREIAGSVLKGHRFVSLCATDLANETLRRMLEGAWGDRVESEPREVIRALRTAVARTLVDYERAKGCDKRPGGRGRQRMVLDDEILPDPDNDLEHAVQASLLLDKLERGTSSLKVRDPEKFVEVAQLALLLGLPQRDIAALTDTSQTTVSLWVRMATAWLRTAIESEPLV